jgi:hypothetical protein
MENFLVMSVTIVTDFHANVSARDTTKSLAYIDRGSMHVAEHHDDLYSWKKYNFFTHILTLYKYSI